MMFRPSRSTAIACGLLCALIQQSGAQSTLYWRSESTNGNWNDANNWWNGTGIQSPPGSEILRFDNNVQTGMNNDAANTTRHQIWFDSGATTSRTIGGSTANGFVAVSGNGPLIQNDSSAAHAINFPITLGADPLTVNANNGDLSLGGVIGGTGSLVKNGANLLTLTGANNYSGKTTISGGTLSISSDGNLGAAPGSFVADQLTIDNGTLAITSAMTVNGNRGVTIANGATIDSSSLGTGGTPDVILGSVIAGSGGLTINGHGNTSDTGGGSGAEFRITGANTFTGDVTINSGVVSFNNDSAFGDAANDIVIAGGGFVATGNRTLPATRDIVLSGGGSKIFRSYGSATFTVNGGISGSGHVRHTDGGTLVLNGANTFTGNIDNVRGNLTLGNSGHTGNVVNQTGTLALKAGNTYSGYTFITGGSTLRLDEDNAAPDGTAVLFYGGTTFNVNGKTDTLGGIFVGSAGDTNVNINLGGAADDGTLTVTRTTMPGGSPTNAGNQLYAKLTGTGNLAYSHGTQHNATWDWLNSANDFAGDIIIEEGRLRVPNDGALGDAGNDLVFNGDVVATLGNQQGKASIQVTNGSSLALGAGRDIILNAGKEGTMYVWGGTTMTVNGKVTGGGNLRKEDGGILLLNNATNDWSGDTKIAVGTVRLGAAGALSANTRPVIAGGTLDLNGFDQSATGLSGGGSGGGNLVGGATLTVTGNGTDDYAGRVTGATVKYAGTGSLTLSGTQDNAGGRAIVDSGTLVLGKASSGSVHVVGAGNATGLTINGGTARLGGSGGDQIYTETNVAMTGGTFDLNERSEGFRGLTGTGGTITNDGSAKSVLTLGETSGAADSYAFAGSITDGSGIIDVNKTGDGTQTLSGANTYSGTTTISGGTLALGAGGSISGSSQIIVGANTTLDVQAPGSWTLGAGQELIGTGTVAGNTTIEGDLAPGASPGTISFTGDLDLAAGSDLLIEIGGTDPADFDRLLVSGDLAAGGNILLLLINGFNPADGDSFDIADFATFTDNGYNFDISGAALGPDLEWDTSSFGSDGIITVIPEPGTTALLAACGLLGLGIRRRR